MILLVALGSALGGSARYLIGLLLDRSGGFPLSTLVVNVAGSFLLGIVVRATGLSAGNTDQVRAFAAIGFCGGFTTFSAFSLDAVRLLEQGSYGKALSYAGLSTGLSLAAVAAGFGVAAFLGSGRASG